MSASVGVVGGYGAVGSAVVRRLHRVLGPGYRLRVGGRRLAAAEELVRRERAGGGEAMAVDVYDDEALRRFCAGCRLVVNASAASYLVVDRVARAALAAGADYVDAGGDLPLLDRLTPLGPAGAGRTALVTAGLMPGLTGLLPRWLAATEFRRPRRLVAYVGVMDRLTPAGAVDYLLSLRTRDEESQAVWQDGRRVTRAAAALTDVELPFFPGRVTAYPYLGYEAQRLAVDLGLTEVRWHAVFDGGASMMATLSRLQGAMAGESDLRAAARELAAAAELDMFGKRPYQLLVFELTGTGPAGDEHTRTLVLRSTDTSEITGTVCALAAAQVLAGRVPPGAHLAAEGLAGAELVEALRATGVVRAFDLFDGVAADAATVEEGVL